VLAVQEQGAQSSRLTPLTCIRLHGGVFARMDGIWWADYAPELAITIQKVFLRLFMRGEIVRVCAAEPDF
jgi:hypothetical protein